jgi:hypothetical protein
VLGKKWKKDVKVLRIEHSTNQPAGTQKAMSECSDLIIGPPIRLRQAGHGSDQTKNIEAGSRLFINGLNQMYSKIGIGTIKKVNEKICLQVIFFSKINGF